MTRSAIEPHPATRGGAATVHRGQLVRLRDLSVDEFWLQNWLVADPARLGLGDLRIADQEQTQAGGGNLDILATSGDVYYSIEVQLGEVDASHGFRVFDYWARNRRRFPGRTHVPVLVAESASGRYRAALEALAEYTPLLVIELRAWRGSTEVILVPEAIVKNESLDVGGTALAVSAGEERTEQDWHDAITEEAWQFHLDFIDWARTNLGETRVDYTPKSYIGVRVGRRVWAPIWPVSDGGTLHLPDPDGSRDEESPAFEYFRDRLATVGLTPSWQPSYNGGANPITIRLRRKDLPRAEVQELLVATHSILTGAGPWSEGRVQPTGG